jgi:hypothetical protein
MPVLHISNMVAPTYGLIRRGYPHHWHDRARGAKSYSTRATTLGDSLPRSWGVVPHDRHDYHGTEPSLDAPCHAGVRRNASCDTGPAMPNDPLGQRSPHH